MTSAFLRSSIPRINSSSREEAVSTTLSRGPAEPQGFFACDNSHRFWGSPSHAPSLSHFAPLAQACTRASTRTSPAPLCQGWATGPQDVVRFHPPCLYWTWRLKGQHSVNSSCVGLSGWRKPAAEALLCPFLRLLTNSFLCGPVGSWSEVQPESQLNQGWRRKCSAWACWRLGGCVVRGGSTGLGVCAVAPVCHPALAWECRGGGVCLWQQ